MLSTWNFNFPQKKKVKKNSKKAVDRSRKASYYMQAVARGQKESPEAGGRHHDN